MSCTCNDIQALSKSKQGLITVMTSNQYDPTRTTTLRNIFARDMRKRFRKLRGLIRKAIVDKDVFGLQQPTTQASLPSRKEFNFERNSRKVGAFMDWFNDRIKNEMLYITHMNQVGDSIESAWTNKYIYDSYGRGLKRANYELYNSGFDVRRIADRGGLKAVMGTPFSVDRVGVLYTRVFQELKGITDAMSTQISRVLSQGMMDGDHPTLLARKLTRTISGPVGDLALTDTLGRFMPAQRRAIILARTEVIRAHHMGMMQEYKNWRVEGLYVKAEFTSADDGRVCSECQALEGNRYDIEKAEGMIPVHPQCRCIMLPYMPKGTEKRKAAAKKVSVNKVKVLQEHEYTTLIRDYPNVENDKK